MSSQGTVRASGERRQEGWTGSTGHFQGSETVLCGVMLADTRHHTCVKTHTMYTKSEPQGKLWSLGDYAVSMGVHQLNKCTTLVATSVIEKVCLCGGRDYMGNVCISAQFCCEPETALNNKVYFLKKV